MTNASDRTDEELARAARDGDARAYDILVRRHLRPAMALAWQSTRHVEDAEDLVQEAFHRAVRALSHWDDRRPFGAWFYTILRNVARDAHGQRKRRDALHSASATTDSEALFPEHEPAAPAGSDPVLSGEIDRAIEALPEMQRACVRLCEIEGFSSIEAGRMLGVSEGTVRTHLHRARRQLRATLVSRKRAAK
jgi:RNA polymerase sigma-70 factor (ECF subfamily)